MKKDDTSSNDKQYASSTDPIRGQVIETSPGKLKAPKSIIPNVLAARGLYQRLRQDHLKRIILYSEIEGLIAGNPPYDPEELAREGLAHIANFNNLDARSYYERNGLGYWNLFNQSENLIDVQLNIPGNPDVARWSDIISTNFTKCMRQFSAFGVAMNTHVAQIVKFGLSPLIWPDEDDWMFRVVELQRFFVPDQAQVDIRQITYLAIDTEFTLQYLYSVYEEFKDADPDSTPWNIPELAKLIVWRANSYSGQAKIIDIMDFQRRLQDNDFGFDNLFGDVVRITSLLYKEYSGKISHFMFDSPASTTSDFLYKETEQYKNFEDVYILFTASPGEFNIHSNRGLGHKIFSYCQAGMQLDCSIVDMSRWSSSIFLRSMNTGSRDAESIRLYPGIPTHIGTAEFVPNRLGENIGQLVSAAQYLSSKIQFNTALSGDDPGMPDRDKQGGSVSQSQATARSFKEFGILKNSTSHFYSQMDLVYKNMIRKMLACKKGHPNYDIVKEWKELCLNDGIPPEIFELRADKIDAFGNPRQFTTIKAARVAGDGSTAGLIMGLDAMAPIVGTFGPKARDFHTRMYIKAIFGPEFVDSYMQDSNDPDETAGGASLAGVENNGMLQGYSPIFSPDNQHRAHIAIHMALASNTIEQLQQQQTDPVEADKIFTVLIPHTEEHLQAVSEDPFSADFMAQIQQPWGQIAQYAQLNKKNAGAMLQSRLEEEQKNMEAEQKAMDAEELKTMQAMGEEKRKDLKVEATVARADRADRTRGIIKLNEVERKAQLEKERIERDATNKRYKIALDAQNKRVKDNADSRIKEEKSVREQISDMNGEDPAPYNIEGRKKIDWNKNKPK